MGDVTTSHGHGGDPLPSIHLPPVLETSPRDAAPAGRGGLTPHPVECASIRDSIRESICPPPVECASIASCDRGHVASCDLRLLLWQCTSLPVTAPCAPGSRPVRRRAHPVRQRTYPARRAHPALARPENGGEPAVSQPGRAPCAAWSRACCMVRHVQRAGRAKSGLARPGPTRGTAWLDPSPGCVLHSPGSGVLRSGADTTLD